MSEPAAILTAAEECRHVFRSATKHARLMQDEWAENRLADFNLWAIGAGVFAQGKASLDRRLGADPVTLRILVNLLMMLCVLMEDCLTQASDLGHEALEDALVLSHKELDRMQDVDNNLSQLTRLTVAIRKAGTRSRLEKADTTFDPHSPSLRALRQHLEILLWVRPDEHGTSSSSLQYINQQSLTSIQLRLIDANLRRRNRFLYAQKHALKLAVSPTRYRQDTRPLPIVVDPTHPPPSSYRSRETTTIPNSQVEWTFPGDLQAYSTTTATRLDEPITLPPPMVTRAPSTAVSVTSSRISYPAPPPIHDHQGVFRCPCCCQSLPTSTGRGNQWKKHLMVDVLPYTCIIDDCPQPHIFYMSKDLWLRHMNKEHGGTWQWVCHACSQKNIHVTFKDEEHFTTHLKEQHRRGIRSTQIPTLLAAWKRRVPLKIQSCPICEFEDENHTVVLDHTAEHVHAFSLRSLPWAPDEGGENPGIEEDYHDGRSYFNHNPYFDVNSRQSTLSSDSDGGSSWDQDLERSPDLGFEQSLGNHEHLLTEDVVEMLPQNISDRENARRWLAGLTQEPGSQTSTPGADEPALTAVEESDDQLWEGGGVVYVDTEVSNTPAPRFNEYFIPGDGISHQVIQSDICRYLGHDALVRRGDHQGRKGYFIRAYRNLTREMIQDLRNDSAQWEADHARREETKYPSQQTKTVESSTPHKREWPTPVRMYVQRSFYPGNQISDVTEEEMEAKLKAVIKEAAENDMLEKIDWDNLPLPQLMVQNDRNKFVANPASVRHRASVSVFSLPGLLTLPPDPHRHPQKHDVTPGEPSRPQYLASYPAAIHAAQAVSGPRLIRSVPSSSEQFHDMTRELEGRRRQADKHHEDSRRLRRDPQQWQ